MEEYRQRAPTSTTTQNKAKTPVHTINSLAAHFGIKDMSIRQSGPRSRGMMSTDEEYYSYTNGDLWDEGTDPLRFWEVSTLQLAEIYLRMATIE